MGLARRKTAAAQQQQQQQQLHPGGQLSIKSPRPRLAKGRDCWTSSLRSLPALVMVVAVAVGVCLGLAHKHQGVDLADTIADLLHLRTAPAPFIGAVGSKGASSTRGSKREAAQQAAAQGESQGGSQSKGLAGPITVQIHANGESQPVASLTLRPQEIRRPSDLREAASALLPACDEDECRVFTQFGYEVKALWALTEGQRLFLVPPYRHFVWPTFHVGHRVELPGVASAYSGKRVTLETVSESPRVFVVDNFLSQQDADELIDFALGIDDDVYGLKRSTTGAKGAEISTQRTSENAFDTSSPVAMKLKRRVFEVLGMRPYDEELADGLQVLRYNRSKAYISHLDYLEVNNVASNTHDFDSSGEGTNRFATMLLYLNDVEEGGQTVFPHADRLDGPPMSTKEGMAVAEERGWTKDLAPGSWQMRMMGQCASRLAIQPRKARAVLFYSQHPDGKSDHKSLHGACPVVRGQKWAANLWVWNGPRYGYNPRTRHERSTKRTKRAKGPAAGGADDEMGPEEQQQADGGSSLQGVDATFMSAVPAQLFWRSPVGEDSYFGELAPDRPPQRMQTYTGHEWVLKEKDGRELKKWRIDDGTDHVYRFG